MEVDDPDLVPLDRCTSFAARLGAFLELLSGGGDTERSLFLASRAKRSASMALRSRPAKDAVVVDNWLATFTIVIGCEAIDVLSLLRPAELCSSVSASDMAMAAFKSSSSVVEVAIA